MVYLWGNLILGIMKKVMLLMVGLMVAVAAKGQFLMSGHIRYDLHGGDIVALDTYAAGADIQLSGPLHIPYNFSRGIDTYNVVGVGPSAFANQPITELKLTHGIRTISVQAFQWCTELRRIEWAEGLKFIEGAAFQGCSSLEEVVMPSTVKLVGMNAFNQCRALRKVVMSKDLESLGEMAFAGDTHMESLTFTGHRLGEIPRECFNDCNALKQVVLPPGLRIVGERAFRWCIELESVTFPAQIERIDSEAFAVCRKLGAVNILSRRPPRVAPDAFMAEHFSGATLHVPAGASGAYRNAPVWGQFANIVDDL